MLKLVISLLLSLIHLFSLISPTHAATDTPQLGNAKYLLRNGDAQEKIDLMFIPHQIEDWDTLESRLRSWVLDDENSLFNTEPFDQFQDKFNVFYLDKNIDDEFFSCSYSVYDVSSQVGSFKGCSNDKMIQYYQQFQPDYIIYISKFAASNANNKAANLGVMKTTQKFLHEFGHLFAGLDEEYLYIGGEYCREQPKKEACFQNLEKYASGMVNLDNLGCTKWCQAYDHNKVNSELARCSQHQTKISCEGQPPYANTGCQWWEYSHPWFNQAQCVPTNERLGNIGLSCVEGTGCYGGGKNDLFKALQSGLMSSGNVNK